MNGSGAPGARPAGARCRVTPGGGARSPGTAPAPAVTVVPPSATLAGAAAGDPPAYGRTLRIALAMRGGVSLAVWIGGAVAELDVLRRIRLHREAAGTVRALLLHPSARPHPRLVERARVYAGLLSDAGYDRVELDILAGASAGGLNGVVHAVAQRAGTDLDGLGRLWEEHAGLARLLRPLGRRPVDSLLRGDDYLWPRVQEALTAVHGAAEHHPELVAEHVTVELSATVLDSDPAAGAGVAEGQAGFRFASPEPGSPAPALGNGIPSRADAGDPAATGPALARLAYAARATSSLPGAFEPAAVWSAPTRGVLGDFPRPDLSHAFSAHRDAGALPFRVVDGGVFDNIPIDRALDAAATRASLRHADRCLLYLDPDPPAPPRPGAAHHDLPRLARTLGAALSRLLRRETAEGEVLALSDRLGEQLLADGRRHPLAALVDDWDPAALERRRRAYVRHRGRADAELLGRVLTRPAEWQLGSTLARRAALRARPPAELGPLRTELARRCDALSRGPLEDPAAAGVLRGPQALFDAASCVLSWIRFLEFLVLRFEGLPSPLAGFDAGPVRGCAYRLLAVAGHGRDRALAAALDATADPAVPGTAAVPAWLADPAGPGDRGAWADGDPWAELDAVVAALRDVHAGVEEHLAAVAAPDGAAPGNPAAADLPPADADDGAGSWRTAWRESPWHTVPGTGAAFGAADLPPALAAAGMPAALSRIAYGEIRGDRAPARPGDFGPVAGRWARDRLQRALDAAADPGVPAGELRAVLFAGGDRLPAGSKLAGAGLANLQGFLARDWRTGDWWWGRLDAAAGVAALLRGLPAAGNPGDAAGAGGAAGERTGLPAGGPAPGPATTGDAAGPLQRSVLAQLGGRDPERALAVLGAGADRLDRLAPGYRVSLASRGLRVLGRALAGTPGPPRAVWELALFVLQPVLVLAPLLLAPVRAALALVLTGAALALTAGPGGTGPGVLPALTGLAGAALLAALVRTGLRARRRWSRVLAAAGNALPRVPPAARPTAEPAADELTAVRGAARRRAGWCAAAAAALLLPAGAGAVRGHGLLVLTALSGSLGLVCAAAAVARRVPGAGARDEVVRAAAVVLGAVAVGAPTVLVLPSVPVGAPGATGLLVLGAVLAALGGLVLAGFLRPGWAVLLAGAAAAAGGAAASLVWHGPPGPGADLLAVGGAVVLWAAVLWWAPAESMLRIHGPGEELLGR